MADKIKTQIFNRINKSPAHSVFFLSDFAELGSLETVRKVLLQACIAGILSHPSHGIYVKPMKSRFGEVPPPLDKIARKIAERDHVKIMPAGDTAANIIGLSTQVPMTASYLTTGSSRVVNIGNRRIVFRHAAPRNFAYRGTTIPLMVQALKNLGEKNINADILSALHRYMEKAKDADTFSRDVLMAPLWIQSVIKPLIKKKDETLATL